MLQFTINMDAWNSLPEDLQHIVSNCCQAINNDVRAEYNYGNAMALQQLGQDPNIEIRRLPDDVLTLLHELSLQAMQELSAKDEWAARIQASFTGFQKISEANQLISEKAYMDARALPLGGAD